MAQSASKKQKLSAPEFFSMALPYQPQTREERNAYYTQSMYLHLLEEKGSFMRDSATSISSNERELCEVLVSLPQLIHSCTLFDDYKLPSILPMMKH
jgi:hypothetical protein